MTVDELIIAVKQDYNDLSKISALYEEVEKLSEEDLEKLRSSGYGEMLEMLYSGAVEEAG